jgi:predicted glutamine amidotransferase
MLVAVGRFSVPKILSDFKLIAMNKNEKHELNENNPNFIHSDGWGIVLKESDKLDFYKNAIALWEDPKYQKYFDSNTDFLLLHARKASPGVSVNYAFTHPFNRNDWFFCHNGTVTEYIKSNKSDSEELFVALLDKIKERRNVIESIKEVVKQLKDYTALNFILTNGKKAYVLNKFVLDRPKYYTMKYLVKEGFAVVSSETLRSYEEWHQLGNNTLAELDILTHEVKISKIFSK